MKTTTHTDESLDYWGRLFVANRLDLKGVRFSAFMQNPEAIFEAVTWRDRLELDGHLPLLPRQRAVMDRHEWEAGL